VSRLAQACRKDTKRSAQVSRLLQRLHVCGLIAKVPHSRRWRVTPFGHRVMSAALTVRCKEFPNIYADAAKPLAASVQNAKKTKKESIRLRSFPVSARLALRLVFVDLFSFRLSLLNSGGRRSSPAWGAFFRRGVMERCLSEGPRNEEDGLCPDVSKFDRVSWTEPYAARTLFLVFRYIRDNITKTVPRLVSDHTLDLTDVRSALPHILEPLLVRFLVWNVHNGRGTLKELFHRVG
jgi:hypothetical protein